MKLPLYIWILILPTPALRVCRAQSTDIFELQKITYNPPSAHACRIVLANVILNCTNNSTEVTPAECYTTDIPFLATLGHCLLRRVDTLTTEQIAAWWSRYAAGWSPSQPFPLVPMVSAIDMAGVPNTTLIRGKLLTEASLVSDEDFLVAKSLVISWNEAERYHNRFALIVSGSGIFIPLILFFIEKILHKRSLSLIEAYFINPLSCRILSFNIRDIGDGEPTRGQALFILIMVLLNAILSGIRLYSADNSWKWDAPGASLMGSLADRLGALSVANIFLVVLYGGRNNILLMITDWHHATFLILHRWLGYLATIQTLLHSAMFLTAAIQAYEYLIWSVTQAWISGSSATMAMAILVLLSLFNIRKRLYEAFLLSHILLSTAIIVGTFYHLYFLYRSRITGFELYLWGAVVVWLLDRVVRIIRIAVNGLKTATITVLDEDYIRIDIPTVRAKGHAYLYFPTLTWRVWENHPFSVVSELSCTGTLPDTPDKAFGLEYPDKTFDGGQSSLKIMNSPELQPSPGSTTKKYLDILPTKREIVTQPWNIAGGITSTTEFKMTAISLDNVSPRYITAKPLHTFISAVALPRQWSKNWVRWSDNTKCRDDEGVSFFLRTFAGSTRLLRSRTRLPVLIESNYGIPRDLSGHDLLICIAGGVGITAVLPHLQALRRASSRLSSIAPLSLARTSTYGHSMTSNVHSTCHAMVYWSCRSAPLVTTLRDEVAPYPGEVLVGSRLDVSKILWREIMGVNETWKVVVSVSGPRGMADDARRTVCEIARVRRKGVVTFVDERFGW